MDVTLKLQDILDRLPPFVQKGDTLCKLTIYKEGGLYIMKYTNTKNDLVGHDSDLAVLSSRMLQKLQELDGTRGYNIDWDFW